MNEGMKGHFTEEDRERANKHVHRDSASFTI